MSKPIKGPIQPPTERNRGSMPRVKRPGRDVDHSPTSGTQVKNEWSYTSTTRICHHSMDRDNFTPVSQIPTQIKFA